MKNNSSESLRRVLRHLKPYTGWIILALLCAAGNVAAALYIPILVGKAVEQPRFELPFHVGSAARQFVFGVIFALHRVGDLGIGRNVHPDLRTDIRPMLLPTDSGYRLVWKRSLYRTSTAWCLRPY